MAAWRSATSDGEGTIGVGDLDTIGRDKYGRDKKFYEVGDPERRRPPAHHGPTIVDRSTASPRSSTAT